MATTKTIPFTLEAWKAGGKPVTRGGDPVYDLAYMPTSKKPDRLAGIHEDELITWYEDGVFFPEDGESSLDLFLEVTTAEAPDEAYSFLYRNLESSERPLITWSFLYSSEQEAEKVARIMPRTEPIAIVKITKLKDL
jgi:hypothetical protein